MNQYHVTLPLWDSLAYVRRRSGKTQEEVAQVAGVSRNYISLMERGKAHGITISTLEKIVAAYGFEMTINLIEKGGTP